MEKFWNERYSGSKFVYGEEPNAYFKEELSKLKPGRILLPGDGEGRNWVFAASLGWEVESFDIRSEEKKKAEQLATKQGLKINYKLGPLEDLSYEPNSFDVIALVFTHFHPSVRAEYKKQFTDLLKPGWIIISEDFSTKHIEYNTKNPKARGPEELSFLSSLKQITEEFRSLDTIDL